MLALIIRVVIWTDYDTSFGSNLLGKNSKNCGQGMNLLSNETFYRANMPDVKEQSRFEAPKGNIYLVNSAISFLDVFGAVLCLPFLTGLCVRILKNLVPVCFMYF